jgi:hypothetical protein
VLKIAAKAFSFQSGPDYYYKNEKERLEIRFHGTVVMWGG